MTKRALKSFEKLWKISEKSGSRKSNDVAAWFFSVAMRKRGGKNCQPPMTKFHQLYRQLSHNLPLPMYRIFGVHRLRSVWGFSWVFFLVFPFVFSGFFIARFPGIDEYFTKNASIGLYWTYFKPNTICNGDWKGIFFCWYLIIQFVVLCSNPMYQS